MKIFHVSFRISLEAKSSVSNQVEKEEETVVFLGDRKPVVVKQTHPKKQKQQKQQQKQQKEAEKTSQEESNKEEGKIKRGKRGKLKKMKEKYKFQDEEDRQQRLEILQVGNFISWKKSFHVLMYYFLSEHRIQKSRQR